MEYTIHKLAELAGVSVRTLHYYDSIGLLSPGRAKQNSYRLYTQNDVDRLQQILFYRELGMPLCDIKKAICSTSYNVAEELTRHIAVLKKERNRIDTLIHNAERTIRSIKGENIMTDAEKFKGFKEELIKENENKYGKETRKKYGDKIVNESNEKLAELTQEQYDEATELSNEINRLLKEAFEEGDPAGEKAQRVCGLHKKWLGHYWKSYSKQAHLELAQMYTEDPRFTEYYDKNACPGSALFLLEAMKIYCS